MISSLQHSDGSLCQAPACAAVSAASPIDHLGDRSVDLRIKRGKQHLWQWNRYFAAAAILWLVLAYPIACEAVYLAAVRGWLPWPMATVAYRPWWTAKATMQRKFPFLQGPIARYDRFWWDLTWPNTQRSPWESVRIWPNGVPPRD